MRAEAWAIVTLLVVAVPVAAAYHGADGTAGLVVEGPVEVRGQLRVDAAPAAALFAGAGPFTLSLEAAEVRAELVEVRERTDLSARLIGEAGPRVTRDAFTLKDGHLTLFDTGSAMNALLFSDGLARFTLDAPAGAHLQRVGETAVAPTPEAARDGLTPERFGGEAFSHRMPVDHVRLDAGRAGVRVEGDFGFFLYDAVVALAHADGERLIRTGTINEGDEHVTRYLVLSLRDAEARATGSSSFQGFHARVLEYAVDGSLKGTATAGAVRVADDHPRLDGPFVLRGVLTGRAEPAGERSMRVQAEGDVVALSVPGTTTSYAPDTTAAAASLTVLAAGTLAWYAPTLRFAGAVFLYARFHGPRVLDHAVRDRLLTVLRERPGLSVKEIAFELDVSWSTAAYHLDVLSREGFVVGARHGRHKRFHLAGESPPPAVLEHPTAQRILEAIREAPGLTQRAVADAAGVAPSTASWHLARLVEAGLVNVERVWRERRYAPTAAGSASR